MENQMDKFPFTIITGITEILISQSELRWICLAIPGISKDIPCRDKHQTLYATKSDPRLKGSQSGGCKRPFWSSYWGLCGHIG